MIQATGLSHIALRVTSVERAIAWYGRVLGFEMLTDGHAPTPDRTRNAIGLVAGGTVALEFLETPGGRRWDAAHLGVAGLSLTTQDLDAAVTAFNASGLGETRAWDAGDWRVAFLFDPDGNVVELVQQPAEAASIADFADVLRARNRASSKV